MTDPVLRTDSDAEFFQSMNESAEQMDLSRKAESSFRQEQIADESPPSPGIVAISALLVSLLLGLCCAAIILLR